MNARRDGQFADKGRRADGARQRAIDQEQFIGRVAGDVVQDAGGAGAFGIDDALGEIGEALAMRQAGEFGGFDVGKNPGRGGGPRASPPRGGAGRRCGNCRYTRESAPPG